MKLFLNHQYRCNNQTTFSLKTQSDTYDGNQNNSKAQLFRNGLFENKNAIKDVATISKLLSKEALAGILYGQQVDVLICGGIGGGAQMALAQAGIKLFGGVSGDADAAVEAFVAGNLAYNPDVKCNHHDHEHGEGHTCGDHGCGSHTCGH